MGSVAITVVFQATAVQAARAGSAAAVQQLAGAVCDFPAGESPEIL